MPNLLAKLKSDINYLTNVEKKIAALILENPGEFVKFSLSGLADKAKVSQGSIINFSKKYANGGFPELKLMISACCGSISESATDAGSDSAKDILQKKVDLTSSAFSLTSQVNSDETLKSAAELILNAKKVEIYGVFCSAAVAMHFCYSLMLLGIPVTFASDILTCSISASILDESAVVIAISSSGKTKDIIDAVKNAKENNVPVISITSNANSPLARLSDKVLIACSSGAPDANKSVETCLSQLLLTDAICTYIKSNSTHCDKKRDFELDKILNSHNVEEVEYE